MAGDARHILVVNPLWPHPSHSVRSANVVIFEMLVALVRVGFRVTFLRVALQGEDPAPDEEEQAGIQSLRDAGVAMPEPFVLPPARRGRPEIEHRGLAGDVVRRLGADVVLVPWTTWPTVLFAEAPVTRFAYYGNPEPKVLRTRAEFERRHGGSLWTYLKSRARGVLLQREHLATLRRYDLLGDVAANDAAWYSEQGHPNAFYIRNLWIDRLGDGWRAARDATEVIEPLRIIGNVGKLSATGNTQGLYLLGTELLPELRRVLDGRAFEVHVLGAHEPHPVVAEVLEQPEIHRRGFVDDIDAELLAAPVFLGLNNASPFKVCHTRYLHAWSLGACVVAHRDAALSIPEMVHGVNCLLGSSMAEIAALVRDAGDDVELRRRIGQGGRDAFEQQFTAEHVAAEIAARLQTAAAAGERTG